MPGIHLLVLSKCLNDQYYCYDSIGLTYWLVSPPPKPQHLVFERQEVQDLNYLV